MKEDNLSIQQYNQAAEAIKVAILQSQYEAAKGVNRVQLALYYSIGKFISIKTRKGAWGTNALQTISDKLRKDLPGLRGFSATSLKKMRLFYENWIELDANSSVTTDEISDYVSPITLSLTANTSFPLEDFLRVPFSHHTEIFSRVKDSEARLYYIHRTAEEYLSVERLVKLIKENAFEHHNTIPSNFVTTISNTSLVRKAVMMFKDEYLLDFIYNN